MNPIQIAYLKHFLLDKGEQKKFLRNYRQKGLDSNPVSVEEYFNKASVDNVLLRGFAMMSKTFGFGVRNRDTFSYWKELDDQWHKYISIMENNHSNERWWELKGTFAILRQNWDNEHFWLKENMESPDATFARLGVEADALNVIQTISFDTPEIDEIAEEKEESEEVDPFAEFEFLDDVRGTSSHRRLKKGEASINLRNSSFKILFNGFDSENILKRGFSFVRFARKKNAADDGVFLVCNNRDGAKLGHNKSNGKIENVVISSKDIVTKITNHLSIKETYVVLRVEEITSPSQELLVYKISL